MFLEDRVPIDGFANVQSLRPWAENTRPGYKAPLTDLLLPYA
jgi:hypothetical protein